MALKRFGLNVMIKISLYLDPISLIHLQETSKYVHELSKLDTFQLERVYDHPMNQHIYKPKGRMSHDQLGVEFGGSPVSNPRDMGRHVSREIERYVIYLIRRDSDYRPDLQEVLKHKNITLLTQAMLHGGTEQLYKCGEYSQSPKAIGSYHEDKYHSKLRENNLHVYTDADHDAVRAIQRQHTSEFKKMYYYYKISVIAGNINSYFKLINIVGNYLPDRHHELAYYKRQVLLLGGHKKQLYYGEYDDAINKYTSPDDIKTWNSQLKDTIDMYQRLSRYRPPWMLVPSAEFAYRGRYDEEPEVEFPNCEYYLSDIIFQGLKKFGESAKTIILTSFNSNNVESANILSTMAQFYRKKDESQYVKYSLMILKCPLPDRVSSRKAYIKKYIPDLKELLATSSLSQLTLSQLHT